MPQVIEVPGMGQVEFPDGMSDADITAAIQRNMKPAAPKPAGNFLDRMDAALGLGGTPGTSELDKWKNAAINVGSAIGRPLAQAVVAPANMVVDYNQALHNVASDAVKKLRGQSLSDLVTGDIKRPMFPELMSQKFNSALDSVTRAPTSTGGKVAEGLTSMLMGAALPSPKFNIGNVPDNFVRPSPDLMRQFTLAKSQDSGYVVPPSTTNPSIGNKFLESFGGKDATAQDAATANMSVTNRLVRRALGLPEDAEISSAQLARLRNEAGSAFQKIRGVGTINTTPEYTKALDKIAAPFVNTAKDFPEIADQGVIKMVDSLRKESFDSSSAVDAIQTLRDLASKAYASSDKATGKAYRGMADVLESAIEKHLSGSEGTAGLLKDFKDARKLIAQTYSVEKALNPATGNVSAVKLGQQMTRGKPMSGDLATAGQFGQAFPKAAREIADSGSVRNTDVILGGATAALSREPSYLLYPFARQGARELLLSKAGQSLAKPGNGLSLPLPILQAILAGQNRLTPLQ